MTGFPLLARIMVRVLLVVADVFEHIRIRGYLKPDIFRPRFRVCLGIVDRDLDVHVPEVRTRETLGRVQRVGMGVTGVIEPAPIVEPPGLDNQGVSIPFADGITIPGGKLDFGKAAPIHENLAVVLHLLVKNGEYGGGLNDSFRPAVHIGVRDGVR